MIVVSLCKPSAKKRKMLTLTENINQVTPTTRKMLKKQHYKEADTKLMIKKRIVAYSKTLTGSVLFFLLLTKL